MPTQPAHPSSLGLSYPGLGDPPRVLAKCSKESTGVSKLEGPTGGCGGKRAWRKMGQLQPEETQGRSPEGASWKEEQLLGQAVSGGG